MDEKGFVVLGEKPLRGDYSAKRADFTIDQGFDLYGADDHALWRELYARQARLLPDYAEAGFLKALAALDCADGIPDFEKASRVLTKATGWSLVAVPGLIPNDHFFDHLAHRRFPVANWIRKREEMDYLVEPDVFHDFFGHVPMLMNPVFADYLAGYGREGANATRADALTELSRVYWYMVEFGLIRTEAGLKIYGAGILSSQGETIFARDSAKPNRIGFDLKRVMRTKYRIDDFQETYFVLERFEDLFRATEGVDLTPIYAEVKALPTIDARAVLPSDTVFTMGENGYRVAA